MGENVDCPPPNRRVRVRSRRGLRGWHRWLGLLAAFPVLVIAVTGLLLNHGPGLRLDQQMVKSDWIFRWYGLAPQGEMRAFQLERGAGTAGAWLVEWGGQVFYRGKTVGNPGRIRAAGAVAGEVVAAGDEGLLLLGDEGQVLEELHASLLPPGTITRGGELQGRFVFETSEGVYHLKAWPQHERIDGAAVRWFPGQVAPPAEVAREVEHACRGEGFPLSRLVLDLHSGRIFGKAGVVVYDLAAALFLILAATGVVLAMGRRS